jgi:hypothetical protein
MIEWSETTYAGGKKRKFWGVTAARTDDAIVAAFAEQWRKVFTDVLSWYAPDRWNGLFCGVNVYEGTFDFSPVLDFELIKSLPGCHLKFDALEEILQGDFETDEEFDAACQRETSRYVNFILSGWELAQPHVAKECKLDAQQIPFRVIDTPEPVPPLAETVLTLV